MKINKKSKIIRSIFLVLIINLVFSAFIKTNVSAAENNYNTNDEKIIQDINLNDNFDTSSVIVVLKANKSQYRGISNEILEKLYAFDEIVSLEDLTKVPTDMLLDEKTLKPEDTETINHLSNINFKQIIKVNLNTGDKSEVVDVIKKLELLKEILYVGPNYIYMADTITVDDVMFSE